MQQSLQHLWQTIRWEPSHVRTHFPKRLGANAHHEDICSRISLVRRSVNQLGAEFEFVYGRKSEKILKIEEQLPYERFKLGLDSYSAVQWGRRRIRSEALKRRLPRSCKVEGHPTHFKAECCRTWTVSLAFCLIPTIWGRFAEPEIKTLQQKSVQPIVAWLCVWILTMPRPFITPESNREHNCPCCLGRRDRSCYSLHCCSKWFELQLVKM